MAFNEFPLNHLKVLLQNPISFVSMLYSLDTTADSTVIAYPKMSANSGKRILAVEANKINCYITGQVFRSTFRDGNLFFFDAEMIADNGNDIFR